MAIVLVVIVIFIALGIVLWQFQKFTERHREKRVLQWQNEFQQRREWLEARFYDAASKRGSPRGLLWKEIDFDNRIAFARDRRNGGLTAFVGVAIQFEAIQDGDMEDVAAVANQKAATAVFRHNGQEWTTDGRAIFNLNPDEAIEYYQSELEPVK